MKVLEIINREMTSVLNIDYSYMVNDKPKISYPYVTSEYFESSYSFEDGRTQGSMILNLWNRGSDLELFNLVETIKQHFQNYTESDDAFSCHISFDNMTSVYTGEENLRKIEIYLSISYWKG